MISKLKKLNKTFPYLICLLFIILQVIILNYDSTSGREYENISIRLNMLETENSLLVQQIASGSSYIAISQKAKTLGLTPKKSVISLYGPQPLAALSNTL